MTRRVVTASADWSIQKLATFFTENSISGAPVCSEYGAVIGVVSLSDVARYREDGTTAPQPKNEPPAYYLDDGASQSQSVPFPDIQRAKKTKVRDIMMPALFAIAENAPIRDVADCLAQSRLHRVLVVRNGTERDLVRTVTTTDVLDWIHIHFLAPPRSLDTGQKRRHPSGYEPAQRA